MNRERLAGHRSGRRYISSGKLGLSKIQTGKDAGLSPLQHVRIGLLVKLDFAGTMNLLRYIHAVDDLADGVAKTRGIFFKLEELFVEILRNNEPLRHIVMHCGNSDCVDLLLVSLALALVARQIGTLNSRRNLVNGNPGVHGSGLDCLDEAFHGQGNGICAEAELKRGVVDFFQDGLHPVDRIRTGEQQWFNDIVKINMTNVVHSNLPVHRRNYDHIVGSIDPGVHDRAERAWAQ